MPQYVSIYYNILQCISQYVTVYHSIFPFQAVQPSAGNMVYDEFVDNMASFSQLEMRLSHLHPAEILYPHGTPKALEESLLQWKRYR